MKPSILFNRLGDDTQVQHSVLGPNGSWTGTHTYKNVKFDNGVYSNSRSNYIDFTGSFFNPNSFTVEMGIKTDFAVTDGKPGDGGNHGIFSWNYNSNGNTHDWLRGIFDRNRGIFFQFAISGTNYGFICTSGTWSANTPHHLAFVYDMSGINGGSDILEIYLDGSCIYNSTNSTQSQNNTGSHFYILITDSGVGAWSPALSGNIDNLKVYDYAKTDFSDRFNERGGLNDQHIVS